MDSKHGATTAQLGVQLENQLCACEPSPCPERRPVFIQSVVRGSEAERAGLKAGMRVLRINHEEVWADQAGREVI